MKKTYLSSKENIILNAIDVINELGIHRLSTRELAKKLGVTDASLYRHFKSKQDIILAVLDYYSYFDNSIIKTIQNNKLKPKEGILFFVKSFAEYYENYPAMTAILHSYDILLHDSVTAQKVKQIYNTRSTYFTHLIQEAKNQKEIADDFVSEDLSDTILGIIGSITLKWRINMYSFSLKQKILSTVKSLIKMSAVTSNITESI